MVVAEGKPGSDGGPAGEVAAVGLGQSSNTAGIIAMLGAMASFACGDSLMKLTSADLPTGELVWLRSLLMVAATSLFALATGAFRNAWRLLAPPMMLRAFADIGGAIAYQSALARMAFADLTAISQVNPLLVTAASAIFLAERVGWRRWTAACVGLMGVLLIIRPGTSAFTWWSVVALLSVLCATTRDVATKCIDRAVPAVLIIWVSSGVVGLGAMLLAFVESWHWPAPHVVLQIVGAAVFSLMGHAFIIAAVRKGDLSAVAPFRYSIIVWALILGYVIWGHFPDSMTLLGMAIVIGAGIYTFHRELAVRRKAQV